MILVVLCVVAPATLLVACRLIWKVPLSMVILLFVFGPGPAALALVLTPELARRSLSIPDLLGACLVFYLIALPASGFWAAAIGCIGWEITRRVEVLRDRVDLITGGVAGVILGVAVSFALWNMFFLDPYFPGRSVEHMTDPLTALSTFLQGAGAGAICGMIVAYYLRRSISAPIRQER